jgi:phospholipase C
MPPIANPSALTTGLSGSSDALTGTNACGVPLAGAVMGRCGYGPRLPLLVISPFARANFVDHSVTDQSSMIRFIEDNWSLGRIDQASPKSVSAGGSFDQIAGTLNSMFDFDRDEIRWDGHDRDDLFGPFHRFDNDGSRDRDDRSRILLLDPNTGEVVSR